MLISSSIPTSAAAFRPSAQAQQEVWANGITDTVVEGGHRYELPSGHAGIPSQIEVKQRWGGLLSPKVSAHDAQGNKLEAGSTLAGLHRGVYVHDPKSGIDTYFDPKEHTVEASTPEKRDVTTTGPLGNFVHINWTQEASETIDAQGHQIFKANLGGLKEIVGAEMAGPHASLPITVSDTSHYTEISFVSGAAPQARQVESDRSLGEKSQPLAATLDDKGGVMITGENSCQYFGLLFNPAH